MDIGDYLIKKGYASPDQVKEAREWQRTTGGDFVEILIGRGVNSRDAYLAKAQKLGVPFVDLTIYKPDAVAINTVPVHIAMKHNMIPIKTDGDTLYVAMCDFNNIAANDDVRLISRCFVRGVIARSTLSARSR